jgi:Ca2+-dependent lipid-binding protein
VHGARNLLGKDMTGQSDPFCTFYLTTNPHARCNTSYKARTLNPTWNEDFVLDVNSVEQVWWRIGRHVVTCPVQDSLRVDVWDFNPDESVNDKLGKINQVIYRHLVELVFNIFPGERWPWPEEVHQGDVACHGW